MEPWLVDLLKACTRLVGDLGLLVDDARDLVQEKFEVACLERAKLKKELEKIQ